MVARRVELEPSVAVDSSDGLAASVTEPLTGLPRGRSHDCVVDCFWNHPTMSTSASGPPASSGAPMIGIGVVLLAERLIIG
jgi:hypothetical protein